MNLANKESCEITLYQLTRPLSKRLRRLCREVLLRLPPNWDIHRTLSFEESSECPTPGPGTIGYVSAHREEGGIGFPHELVQEQEPAQHWVVTLYVLHLDLLSDKAARYVIAHALGHVASGLQTEGLVVGMVPGSQASREQDEAAPQKTHHEEPIDPLTTPWGFSDEQQQFLSEAGVRR